jgi:serine/threonine protein kinase
VGLLLLQGHIVTSKQLEISHSWCASEALSRTAPTGSPLVPSDHVYLNFCCCCCCCCFLFTADSLLQGHIVTSKQLEINPSWCAPEALCCDERVHYGIYSDVYSFGICLWELLTWQLPWTAPYAYCGDEYCPQLHLHEFHISNAVRVGEATFGSG